jgi:hypothetical protein
MKTIIYIDGENFLHRVAHVLKAKSIITHKIEITHLSAAKLLKDLFPDASSIEIKYYGTKLRSRGIDDEILHQKAVEMVESQRRLKRDLERQHISFITSGNLRLRDGVACHKFGHKE